MTTRVSRVRIITLTALLSLALLLARGPYLSPALGQLVWRMKNCLWSINWTLVKLESCSWNSLTLESFSYAAFYWSHLVWKVSGSDPAHVGPMTSLLTFQNSTNVGCKWWRLRFHHIVYHGFCLQRQLMFTPMSNCCSDDANQFSAAPKMLCGICTNLCLNGDGFLFYRLWPGFVSSSIEPWKMKNPNSEFKYFWYLTLACDATPGTTFYKKFDLFGIWYLYLSCRATGEKNLQCKGPL